VGSSGPKCMFSSASPKRTAERQSFPRSNPHRRHGATLHMESGTYRHVKVRLGLCAGNGVRCSFCFSKTSSHSPHQSTLEPEKIKLSISVLRSANSAVSAKLN